MPFERMKEEKVFGKKLSFEQTKKTAVDRAKKRLELALPNHPQAYYADMLERILLTATGQGYTIESVTESFIQGAKVRGE